MEFPKNIAIPRMFHIILTFGDQEKSQLSQKDPVQEVANT